MLKIWIENSTNKPPKYISSEKIEWNLGKLKAGEEIIIHYTVRLNSSEDFYESSEKSRKYTFFKNNKYNNW